MNKLLVIAVVLCLASGAYAVVPIGYTDDFDTNTDNRHQIAVAGNNGNPESFTWDFTPVNQLDLSPIWYWAPASNEEDPDIWTEGTAVSDWLRMGSMEQGEDNMNIVSPEVGVFDMVAMDANTVLSIDIRIDTFDDRALTNQTFSFWLYSGAWDADDSLWRRTGYIRTGSGTWGQVVPNGAVEDVWNTYTSDLGTIGSGPSNVTDYDSAGTGRGFVHGTWDVSSQVLIRLDVGGLQAGDIVSLRNLSITRIPEPGTMAMMGLGLLSLLGIRRKK